MNIETGEVKAWDQLTDEEKASGQWVPATEENLRWFRERQKRAEIRERNRLVRRDNEARAHPKLNGDRIQRANAKRVRRKRRNLAQFG